MYSLVIKSRRTQMQQVQVTDEMRARWAADMAKLANVDLSLKTAGLIKMLGEGKIPAEQVEGAREMLAAAKAEMATRGL
jgi:hypothetical protein